MVVVTVCNSARDKTIGQASRSSQECHLTYGSVGILGSPLRVVCEELRLNRWGQL